LREEQETATVNETFDESSYLDIDASGSVCSSARITASENKDGSKDQEETDVKCIVLGDGKNLPQNYDIATAVNRTNVDVNEENGELSVSRIALEANEHPETATREIALDNGESETSPSRRSLDNREDVSASKDDTEARAEAYARAIDGASSFEAAMSGEEDNKTRDMEALTPLTKRSIDGTDLDDSARGKSADLSSAGSRTSMLNMGQNLSPEKSDEERTKVERTGKIS